MKNNIDLTKIKIEKLNSIELNDLYNKIEFNDDEDLFEFINNSMSRTELIEFYIDKLDKSETLELIKLIQQNKK